jgi:AraC-like DNA-binding protein
MNDLVVNEQFAELARMLQHIPGAQAYGEIYPLEIQVYGALEQAPVGYDWDGMRRGADPNHPFVVFQYTLAGWGIYEDRSGSYTLQPGHAFTALIPTAHRYYLPAASSGWQYIWLIVFHPYIVQRIARLVREHGPVITLVPGHRLISRLVEIHQSVHQRTVQDSIAREQMLFAFLWEYERYHMQQRPLAERERLINEVRQFVITSLQQPLGVAELARWRGMSRSNFSHHFKAITGMAPASFIMQIRLEEAIGLLLHTRQSVAQIAQHTGFASANHFCKVFRQHYHLSPGAFRKQVS